MKKYSILFFAILSLAFFQACSDDDDNNDQPATNNTANNNGGGGNGSGTGGGTGSGGIPPNSMKAIVDGSTIDFQIVNGSKIDTTILVTGLANSTNYPQIVLSIPVSVKKDTFDAPFGSNEPSFNYSNGQSANDFYFPSTAKVIIRNIDTSRSLVNGTFEGLLINSNTPPDSLRIDSGQFNRFYN